MTARLFPLLLVALAVPAGAQLVPVSLKASVNAIATADQSSVQASNEQNGATVAAVALREAGHGRASTAIQSTAYAHELSVYADLRVSATQAGSPAAAASRASSRYVFDVVDPLSFYAGYVAGSFLTGNTSHMSGSTSFGFARQGEDGSESVLHSYTAPHTGLDGGGFRLQLLPGRYVAWISSDVGLVGNETGPYSARYRSGISVQMGVGPALPVPEPASMAVLGLGLAALKRRRSSRA